MFVVRYFFAGIPCPLGKRPSWPHSLFIAGIHACEAKATIHGRTL